MEEKGVVGVDEELIEREAARCRVRNARRETVDAIGYLMSVCVHAGSSMGAESLAAQYTFELVFGAFQSQASAVNL
jgi:hypothetical protein